MDANAPNLPRTARFAPALALGGALFLGLSGCAGNRTADDTPGSAPSVTDTAGRNSPASAADGLRIDGQGRPGVRTAGFTGNSNSGGGGGGDASSSASAAPAGAPLTLLYPTGERSTSSLLVEKQLPAEVALDKPFDYMIKVTNLTGEPIDGVVVNEPVPDHMEIRSATPEPSSESGGEAKWNLNLAANASQTIRVSAVANEAKPIRQCSTVSYDPTLCSQLAVVSPALNLALRAPETTLQCAGYEVIYAVSNDGTGTARGVVVREALPAGVTLDGGESEVRIDVGDVPAGKTLEFKRVVRPSTTGSVELAGEATGANGLSAEADAVTTAVTEARLEITAEAPEMRFIGRPFTHTYTVKNIGDGPAPRTVVTVVVPPSVTIASVDNGGTRSGERGAVTWQLNELAAGAERTVSLDLSGTQRAPVRTTAAARADCAAEATAQAETDLQGIPALLMEVVDEVDPVTVGDETVYVITVTNQGSARDTNVSIVCELEDSMSFVSGTGSSEVTAEGGTVTMQSVPELAPGDASTWRLTVKAESKADARFQVTMNSDQLGRPVSETESTNLYE
ncbi:DUF11 domain-containing protein [Phycisphaera mikurensis]|nr:DUF11 domain-containing protein [Phycisphaera mikurensis]MBB6443363.1 putative repeat protein (TIGR01451 family) [Phycisphaera mikurensis]